MNRAVAMSEEPEPTSALTTAITDTEQSDQCMDVVILSGFFICLFILLGIVGNSITIYVLSKSSRRSGSTYLIRNLATADLITCLMYSPTMFPPLIFSDITFVYVAYISHMAFTMNQVSIFFTTILVWQRYVSICQPHTARSWIQVRRLRVMALGAVIVAVVAYFPGFFLFRLEKSQNGNLKLVRTGLGDIKLFYYLHTVALINVISYVVPMAIILFATVCLIRSLRKMTDVQSEASTKAKRELTVSVVVVVILFVLLQVFRPIRFLLVWIYNPYTVAIGCGQPLVYFAPAPSITTVANASVNFFIFVLCAKGFRKEVLKMVCKQKDATVEPNSIEFASSKVEN